MEKNVVLEFDELQCQICDNYKNLNEAQGVATPVRFFSNLIAQYCVNIVEDYRKNNQSEYHFQIPDFWFKQNPNARKYLFFTGVEIEVEINLAPNRSFDGDDTGYDTFIEKNGKKYNVTLNNGLITNASIKLTYTGPFNELYDNIVILSMHELTHLYSDYNALLNNAHTTIQTHMYGNLATNNYTHPSYESIRSQDEYEYCVERINDVIYYFSKTEANAFISESYYEVYTIIRQNPDEKAENIIKKLNYYNYLLRANQYYIDSQELKNPEIAQGLANYIASFIHLVKKRTYKRATKNMNYWIEYRWKDIQKKLYRIIEYAKDQYNKRAKHQKNNRNVG